MFLLKNKRFSKTIEIQKSSKYDQNLPSGIDTKKAQCHMRTYGYRPQSSALTKLSVCVLLIISASAHAGDFTFSNWTLLNKIVPKSSGTLLNVYQNGQFLFPTAAQHISISPLVTTTTSKTPTVSPNNPLLELGIEAFFPKRHEFGNDNNRYRTFIFPRGLIGQRKPGDITLAGSYKPYMGRVQVYINGITWGSICGDDWGQQDATVACREMGYSLGGVIARPKMEFGERIGPVVMSKVKCRGYETSLKECPAERWDGKNSLKCKTKYSAAGLICGCPMDVPSSVMSLCYLVKAFPEDSLYCRYSCPPSQILVGDQRRYCNYQQKWTGIRPQCIDIVAPAKPRQLCRIPHKKQLPCLRHPLLENSYLQGNMANSGQYIASLCIVLGCCYNHSALPGSSKCFLPADSSCSNKPCKNGGTCYDVLEENSNYYCKCPGPYGGRNCLFKRSWTCGRPQVLPDLRQLRPQLRIVGGRGVRRGSWPWIVQLREHESYFCSGTLIAPQWVVTAAHCLHLKNIRNGPINNTKWTIVTGQHNRVGLDWTSQSFRVEYAISKNFTNLDIPRKDIALLKLSSPVIINNYTKPICLPSSRNESPQPKTKCWIAGWGKTTITGYMPRNLQQGDIPIISTKKCRENNDPKRGFSKVGNDMICAGYVIGGIDACKGDSGGPLMCSRTDGSWYLAGIISWGYGCAGPRSPGVYTKVSAYMEWIYDVIQHS